MLLPHDWLTAAAHRRVHHRPGRRLGHRLLVAGDGRYRFDLLAIVDDDRDWDRPLPEVLGPPSAAGEWERRRRRSGHGRQHGRRARPRPAAGDVALSLGTSGTAFSVSDHADRRRHGAVAGFADATGRFLPLVCTLNATKVTDTVARLLGVDPDGLDALALRAPAGAGGLVLVPYLDGERTPNRPTPPACSPASAPT